MQLDPAIIILIILAVIYIPFYIYVRKNKSMADRGIVPYGPLVMFKTKKGIHHIDKIAKYTKFWRVFGVASNIIAAVLIIVIVFIIIIDLVMLPAMFNKGGIGIQYALAIPGLNPMLPLVYGVIGLVVAVFVHELAHGIQTRANGMKVESTGILYAVVPMGAFVEPNEEEIKKCSRRARCDMYAAGIATNVIIAVILFIILSAGMLGSLSSPYGDNPAVMNMSKGSPMEDVNGVGYSTIILSIDGVEYTLDEINKTGFFGEYHKVDFVSKSGKFTADVQLGMLMTTSGGTPAAKAGLDGKLLVSINGQPVGLRGDLSKYLSNTSENDEVMIGYVSKGGNPAEPEYTVIKLGKNPNTGYGYLGVVLTLSGLDLSSPNTVLEKAKNPLYGTTNVTEGAFALFSYIGMPIRGYSPIPADLNWWYSSSILPVDVFWVVTYLVFWIFWLNLVLGISNALPARPFDGGFLFMDAVGSIVDKVKKKESQEQRDKITNIISSTVSMVMIFALLLVVLVVIL